MNPNMNPNINPIMFPTMAPQINPMMLTPAQQMNLLNSYWHYCQQNGYDFNNQYIYNQFYQNYLRNLQNNNNFMGGSMPMNNQGFVQQNHQSNIGMVNPNPPPVNPMINYNQNNLPNQPIQPNPPVNQGGQTITHFDVKKPLSVIPRPDGVYLNNQNLNQTVYINCPEGNQNNQNIINIVFQANTGLKLILQFPPNITIRDMIKLYMNKLQLSEGYIGNQVIFLLNGQQMDYNSDKKIGNVLKNYMLITVFDQGGVIGAK